MPTYDYRCEKCNYVFEEFLTISQRNKPTEQECPSTDCNGEVVMLVAAPHMGDAWVHNSKKVDRGFKDRLQEIKGSHPGSTMPIPA